MRAAIIAWSLAFVACTEPASVREETYALEGGSGGVLCPGAELASDPANCGACGNVCASGLCYAGVCADDRAGHVFVIGHSYRSSNGALDRILGNAVFLVEKSTVNVLVYRGGASTELTTAAYGALARAGRIMKRAVARTATRNSAAVQTLLPAADVLVIVPQPQASDGELVALADEWSLPLDDFTRRGGIVVVLDAPSTNAGTPAVLGSLFPITRAAAGPGAMGQVTAQTAITAGRVPLVFALGDSVGYSPTGSLDAVVGDSGAVVVAHRAVY